MQINTVSIIGLGALGILYGNHLSKKIPGRNLRIIADRDRIKKYTEEKVYCNGELCEFHYTTPEESCGPADLLIFAVKYNDLETAIKSTVNQVGEDTIVLSLLNGITSEEIIGQTYGTGNILYCVAQGMDAVKSGNRMYYDHMGILCFGDREPGTISKNTQAVAGFFEQMGVPYEINTNMYRKLWGKFMLNAGVNQAVALFGNSYEDAQKNSPTRDIMISSMREVIALSEKEGINLSESDLEYWLKVIDKLGPQGKPSMLQDIEAGRYSEVELFSGTVLQLGSKHGIPTPVNKMFYEKIKVLESHY